MKNSVKRRQFLQMIMGSAIGGMGLASSFLQAAGPGGKKGKKPNILFLFTDDQTFRSIDALNNPDVHTPNIDRLLKRGTTFTHAFNQGAWNGAVCIASRAMLNTGRYLWKCGGNGCKAPSGDIYPLWGECFGMNGYDTYMTGKWHNGPKTLKKSFKTIGPTGGGMLPSHDTNAKKDKAMGIIKDPYNRPRPGNSWSPSDKTLGGHWMRVDGKIIHSSQRWANRAIKWLKKDVAASSNPFFMYVAFHSPHDPRQSPKEFVDMYPLDKIKVPPNFLPLHPFDPMGNYRTLRDERLAPFPRTKAAVKVHIQEYYALISYADYQIGRILDTLEKTGKADNTIIIFSADHGLAVGQHGLMGKQNQYDHSVRMPLIICGPGIEAGKKIDSMVYMQSLFATTCQMTGITPPKTVQFPSLVPLMTGRKKKLYDIVYGAYTNQQRMVRTERYKLIRYPQAKEVQLFDLKKDPWEIKDLAEDPKYEGLVKRLDAELRRQMKKYGDKLDLDNPKGKKKKSRKKKKSAT